MAADFFLEKGLTRAAYFSTQFHRLQKLRLHGFASRWKAKTGNKISTIVPKLDKRNVPADDWAALCSYIGEKLTKLPKPLAVFAYCDYDASKVETAALESGLRIPEDVAILGVDNDPLVCKNEIVPISSICHDRTRIGYEGAALLDRIMGGRRIRSRTVMILPRQIEERASTCGVYCDDPFAQRVIAFFSSRLSSHTGVQDAAAALGVNRRWLERHFSAHVGHTVSHYLRQLRLVRAYQQVKETDRPLGEIAAECGFANAQHFSNAFREAYGRSPSRARAGG